MNSLENISAAHFHHLMPLGKISIIWAAARQNQQNDLCDQRRIIHPVWSVFNVRMKKSWVLSLPLSAHRRLISLCRCDSWSETLLGARHFVSFVVPWITDLKTSLFPQYIQGVNLAWTQNICSSRLLITCKKSCLRNLFYFCETVDKIDSVNELLNEKISI